MVFFVLSGYLVGGSVLRQIAANRWSWNDYILKRLARLWVVLIPVMFIGLGLDVIGHTFFAGAGSLYAIPPGQDYVQANTFSARMTFSTLIGNILFLQTILVPTAGTNIPLWSLAYEFWYYMAFPLIAISCNGRSSKKKSLVYLLAALGILIFIGSHAAYLFLIWFFGAIVAILPNIILKNNFRKITLGTGMFFVIQFLLMKFLDVNIFIAEINIGTIFSIFLYVLQSNNIENKFNLYTNISQYISRISYTLYVSHVPILIFLANLINYPWRLHPMTVPGFLKYSAIIVCSVIWATLLHWLFESRTDKIRRLVRRVIDNGTHKQVNQRHKRP